MNLPDIAAPESGSKNFLKIKDKESVRGVFVGEILHFFMKWVGSKSIKTTDKDPEGKVRFRCNFVTPGPDGELTVKIWEFPYGVFEQIKSINDEYPLEKTKVKITRLGTGQDTTYQIMPLLTAKDVLIPDQLAAINNMPLHKLEKNDSNQKDSKLSVTTPETGVDGDGLPF